MALDLKRVFSCLGDMEQVFIEAEADARCVSIETVVLECLRDGLANEDMDEVFTATDRQWKSH